MSLRLVVFYGSVRADRQGIRAARFVVNECRARGHEAELVDPVEYRLPLLDKMYKEYPKGQAPETLERIAALIKPVLSMKGQPVGQGGLSGGEGEVRPAKQKPVN